VLKVSASNSDVELIRQYLIGKKKSAKVTFVTFD